MQALPPSDWSERSHALAALLAQVGLGSRSAFQELYRQTAPHLFAVVLRIQGNRSLAEEVLQDVYVNVWRAAQTFDAHRSQPLTWLGSIARHRAIDSLRRQQAQPDTVPLEGPVDPAGDEDRRPSPELASAEPGPMELLERAASARALNDCMAGLRPEQQQGLALAFYQGLSHSEVAEHLGQPLGTVKSWLRRGLLALRTCLDRAAERAH